MNTSSLIDKIGSMFKRQAKVVKRGDTTETSFDTNIASFYYKKIKIERTRKAKYADYAIMDDEYPEISSALDLYADNATKDRTDGNPIQVKSEDARVQNILDDLIERTKIQTMLWDTARDMVKIGDDFDEVIVGSDGWIERLKPLSCETIFKEQDEFGRDLKKPYVQKNDIGQVMAEFEPWQIIHWKNSGQKKMYGESIMKSIRRVYKQLQMMEDGMVIGRLTRSHLRYKFLIDVEGMDKEEAEEYIKRIRKDFRKKRLVNPITGQFETAQNPLSAEEDFFLAVGKDSKADIEVLQGASNLGNIRDVEYFQTKLFTGLKVPKAFMGVEKDIKAKATIVEEDIQFARTVARLRKGLRAGLAQLFDLQLIFQGVTPMKDLYEIAFEPISMVDEMRKWTIEKMKAEVAKIYKIDSALLPDDYLLKHFVGLPDEEIEVILKQNQKISPQLPTPAKTGKIPSLRAAGATGITTPAVGGMHPLAMISQEGDGDGEDGLDTGSFHIATLQMMNLVETLRDLIDLEMNR